MFQHEFTVFVTEKVPSVTVGDTAKLLGNWISALLASRHLWSSSKTVTIFPFALCCLCLGFMSFNITIPVFPADSTSGRAQDDWDGISSWKVSQNANYPLQLQDTWGPLRTVRSIAPWVGKRTHWREGNGGRTQVGKPCLQKESKLAPQKIEVIRDSKSYCLEYLAWW